MPPYNGHGNNSGNGNGAVPFQPRRDYYNGQYPVESGGDGIDNVGDYVARRLVPVILSRSDRPLQLVMNFGDLTIEGGSGMAAFGGGGSSGSSSGSRDGRSHRGSNSILYNAPGCTMTLGRSGHGRNSRFLDTGSGWTVLNEEESDGRMGTRSSGVVERRIGICVQCSRRQLISVIGYCVDCDLSSLPRERLVSAPVGYRTWDATRTIQYPEAGRAWGVQMARDWSGRAGGYRYRTPQYYSDSELTEISRRW